MLQDSLIAQGSVSQFRWVQLYLQTIDTVLVFLNPCHPPLQDEIFQLQSGQITVRCGEQGQISGMFPLGSFSGAF